MFCLMDDESVLHVPMPDSRRGGSSVYGFGFKVIHKQVGNQWANWGTDDCTMHLFIILTLKLKEGTFELELH